jgi:hypothetical protein
MRITKKRLQELSHMLSERDKAILRSVRACRYLSSVQIRRLHYAGSKNAAAGLRGANWETSKLRGFGLIDVLDYRVGGVRAGSKSYVWSLTEAGIKLLRLIDKDATPCKYNFEPSKNFMNHTLEVSEVYVQLTEICRRRQLELVKTEMEPSCWRPYVNEYGKCGTMKPDMYAVTGDNQYEDHWFIEVDMNTESPSVVVEKCRRYTLYCERGIEQKNNGIFPLVVWIAYSENRRAKLQQYITESHEIPEHRKNIFTVIMPDEFETLIAGGVEMKKDEGSIK